MRNASNCWCFMDLYIINNHKMCFFYLSTCLCDMASSSFVFLEYSLDIIQKLSALEQHSRFTLARKLLKRFFFTQTLYLYKLYVKMFTNKIIPFIYELLLDIHSLYLILKDYACFQSSTSPV